MKVGRTSRLPLAAIAGAVLLTASAAHAQTVTTLLKNGPDSEKKVVVVIGDGYAQADLPGYQTWVQNRFIDGMFAQDSFFRANQSAFNVYRVDVASQDSGVGITRYTKASCDTRTKSDDVADATCNAMSAAPCYNHTTALGYVFTDCWGRCWMEGTANTESSIDTILDALVPKRDYEVRILNVLTGEGGGCGGGRKLAVTSGENWQTLAHEFGHMVSNLYDEYTGPTKPAYTGSSINDKNCSTELNNTVVWQGLMSPGIAVPPATVYDAMTMDIDETVGMFEGCKTYGANIYRPVQNCRMRSENNGEFCPVCRGVMNATLSGFPDDMSDYMYYANVPGAMCSGAGVTYTSAAAASNGTAGSSTIVCPARRVQDDAGNFSNTVFGEAFVVDRNPTTDVCCQVFGRTPNGGMVSGSNVCSAGASTSYQRIHLDFPKVQQPYTFAHYAMKCTLPPAASGAASSVLSYRVIQQRY
jgi:hypothetical protein